MRQPTFDCQRSGLLRYHYAPNNDTAAAHDFFCLTASTACDAREAVQRVEAA